MPIKNPKSESKYQIFGLKMNKVMLTDIDKFDTAQTTELIPSEIITELCSIIEASKNLIIAIMKKIIACQTAIPMKKTVAIGLSPFK